MLIVQFVAAKRARLGLALVTVRLRLLIGDRGRGDTFSSTDGVVPYWSSHLGGAKSELIVPGPHGSQHQSQTVGELRLILILHLKHSHAAKPTVAQASY